MDNGDGPSVGLLGLRLEPENGVFQIAEIVEGSSSDIDARNPFRTAGGKVGDFLLAINDQPLTADTNPYQAMEGLAGQTVTLTVSDDEKIDDEDRRLLIKPLRNTGSLRYRQFIQGNRKYVEEKSDGKVGYIHVPDTGINGQSELVRHFHSQRHLPALIIDERWNRDGQIPTRFIELLNRPANDEVASDEFKDYFESTFASWTDSESPIFSNQSSATANAAPIIVDAT